MARGDIVNHTEQELVNLEINTISDESAPVDVWTKFNPTPRSVESLTELEQDPQVIDHSPEQLAELEFGFGPTNEGDFKNAIQNFKDNSDPEVMDYTPNTDPTKPYGTLENPGKISSVSGFVNNLQRPDIAAEEGMVANLIDYSFRNETQFKKKQVKEKAASYDVYTKPLIKELESLEKVIGVDDGLDARFGELGALDRPDGRQSTEISITVEWDGRYANIPLLVEGQTGVKNLLAGEEITDKQMDIAIKRAQERVNDGAYLPTYETEAFAIEDARKRSQLKGAHGQLQGQLDEVFKIRRADIAGELDHEEGIKFDQETLELIFDAAKDDPAAFFAELTNEASRNPQFAFLPIGFRNAASNVLVRTGSKALALSAGVGTAAIFGSAIESSISASEQLRKTGELKVDETIENAKYGALFGAFFGTVFGPLGGFKRTRVQSTTIDPDVELVNKVDADLGKVIEEKGDVVKHVESKLEPADDKGLADELDKYRNEQGLFDEPRVHAPDDEVVEVIENTKVDVVDMPGLSTQTIRRLETAYEPNDTGLLRGRVEPPVLLRRVEIDEYDAPSVDNIKTRGNESAEEIQPDTRTDPDIGNIYFDLVDKHPAIKALDDDIKSVDYLPTQELGSKRTRNFEQFAKNVTAITGTDHINALRILSNELSKLGRETDSKRIREVIRESIKNERIAQTRKSLEEDAFFIERTERLNKLSPEALARMESLIEQRDLLIRSKNSISKEPAGPDNPSLQELELEIQRLDREALDIEHGRIPDTPDAKNIEQLKQLNIVESDEFLNNIGPEPVNGFVRELIPAVKKSTGKTAITATDLIEAVKLARTKALRDGPVDDVEVTFYDNIIDEIRKADQRIKLKRKQKGSASSDAMTVLAAITGAGALGYYLDEKQGALTSIALAAGGLTGARVLKNLVVKHRERMNALREDNILLDDMLDNHLSDMNSDALSTLRMVEAIKKYVPKKSQRILITHALEGNEEAIKKLDVESHQAFLIIKKEFDTIHNIARKNGIIHGYIEHYVPHVWQAKTRSAQEKLVNFFMKKSGGDGSIPFQKTRFFESIEQGKKAGFVPKTEDIADLFGIYHSAVNRAMRTKKLTNKMSETEHNDGRMWLLKNLSDASKGKALHQGYVEIDSPFLPDMLVHPDLKLSMDLLFRSRSDNALLRSMSTLNMILKRFTVGSSFFHAKALMENGLFANGIINMARLDPDFNPVNSLANIPPEILNFKGFPGLESGVKAFMGWFEDGKMFKDSHPALELLKHGEAGDMVDRAVRAGVKIGIIEDLGPDDFFNFLDKIKGIQDKYFGGKFLPEYEFKNGKKITSNPMGIAIGFQKAIDEIMWDRIMTGGKLMTWGIHLERIMQKNLKKHLDDPNNNPLMSLAEAEKKAAAFVNDAFGNQNWEANALRMEEGIRKRIVKKLNSKPGRQLAQLVLFAPDWTVSNIKALVKAIPGINNDPVSRELYQTYVANALGMLFITANAIELALGGNGTKDNEDWLAIEYPDYAGGTSKITLSKQVSEVFGWFARPSQGRKPVPSMVQTGVQKGGIIPKLSYEFLANRQWLTLPDQRFGGRITDRNRRRDECGNLTSYPPPIWHCKDTEAAKFAKATLHVLNKAVPITAKQYTNKGPLSASLGFMGIPHKPSREARRARKNKLEEN